MNTTNSSLLALSSDYDDYHISPVVKVADNLVAASGLFFIIPAINAYKKQLFLECWMFMCFVPINITYDFCDLSVDWCFTSTMAVWMKAFSYLLSLDLAYLYARISIYYRAPLILTEVTFLAFLYQALVFDRSVVHVAFIDGAVLIIASMTIIETYANKKICQRLEGDADEDEDKTNQTPPGAWFLLVVLAIIIYLLLLIFPADPQASTASLVVHAFVHIIWHGVLSTAAALMINPLSEISFTVKKD